MISQEKPDVVFASFSGKEALDFGQSHMQSALVNHIPVLASAFTVKQQQPAWHNNLTSQMMTCASWSDEIQKKFNMRHTAVKKNNNDTSDIFTIMGYETAALIHQALLNNNGSLTGLTSARDLLAKKTISSPRGTLHLNETTLELEGPLYLQDSLQKGIMSNVANETQDVSGPVHDEFKSGWLNPYLCA
jgi:hypothetical protein